jgi:hypothetical protein
MLQPGRGLALTLVAAFAWPPAQAAGQSLAEIAAKEKQRRKGAAAKTYTNSDLEKKGGPPKPTAEAAKPTEPEPTPTSSRASEEITWRARASSLREAVLSAERRIPELQAELEALNLDMQPNPSDAFDPSRLQKREAAKTALRQRIEEAEKALERARQAVLDLEEEARRQSVPPGWLRE